MAPIARFKLLSFVKFLGWCLAWILLLLIFAAIKAPPQAMATLLVLGIIGIPVGAVWLILILFGFIKAPDSQLSPVNTSFDNSSFLPSPPLTVEIVKRFPEIGISKSRENTEFLRQYNAAKSNGIDVDPMHLAERISRSKKIDN
jgi:hypothetical protein